MRSPSPDELGLVRLRRMTGLSVYGLTVLFAALSTWAYLAEVDVSVRAQGFVRPEGNVLRISSESGGWVRSILAGEGDLLRNGDSLLQLADPENEAEIKALEEQIALVLEGLKDVQRRLEVRAEVYRVESGKLAAETEAARQDLNRRRGEYEAQRHVSRLRIERARSEHIANQRLLEAGLISRQEHDRSRSELDLAEAADREVEAREPDDAGLHVLLESAELLRAVYESDRRSLQAEDTPFRSELARLRFDLDRSRLRREEQSVMSPADGRVTFMSQVHPGEYLAPGTLVATLMPSGSRVVVEALVSNREVENVHPGQSARLISEESVRVNGSVLSVGPDALFDESSLGAYRVVIEPEDADLRLGMALEVRLITHTESVLSLLFSRITRSLEDWAGS